VPIVDPGASNELDDFLGPSISEFSHSLGRFQPLIDASELTWSNSDGLQGFFESDPAALP